MIPFGNHFLYVFRCKFWSKNGTMLVLIFCNFGCCYGKVIALFTSILAAKQLLNSTLFIVSNFVRQSTYIGNKTLFCTITLAVLRLIKYANNTSFSCLSSSKKKFQFFWSEKLFIKTKAYNCNSIIIWTAK